MTEINKEIEEMAEEIGRAIIDKISIDFGEKCQDCDFANENNIELSIDSQGIATALHKAGYRPEAEVRAETVNEFVKKCGKDFAILLGVWGSEAQRNALDKAWKTINELAEQYGKEDTI